MDCDRRLARPRAPLEEEQPAAGKPADGDVVKTANPKISFVFQVSHSGLRKSLVVTNAASPRNDPRPVGRTQEAEAGASPEPLVHKNGAIPHDFNDLMRKRSVPWAERATLGGYPSRMQTN